MKTRYSRRMSFLYIISLRLFIRECLDKILYNNIQGKHISLRHWKIKLKLLTNKSVAHSTRNKIKGYYKFQNWLKCERSELGLQDVEGKGVRYVKKCISLLGVIVCIKKKTILSFSVHDSFKHSFKYELWW